MIMYTTILSEQIDDLQNQTDTVLNSVRNVRNELDKLVNKYEEAAQAATGMTGIRYDRDKVQTSCHSHDDVMVRMLELEEQIQQKRKEYSEACDFLNRIFSYAGLTNDEYFVMYMRYMTSKCFSFEAIAQKHGNMDRKRSFYLYKKAYLKVEAKLEAEGHVRLKKMEVPEMDFNADRSLAHRCYGILV